MGPGKYFMESERLGFRIWNEDDFDLALELWGNFEVTKYFDSRGRFSDAMLFERLKNEIEMEKLYKVQYWPFFNLKTGEFIGACGLRPYDPDNRIYETGFHIVSSHWRKGYAMDAALMIFRYAFEELNAEKLFAGHNPENKASEILLKKLGFLYSHDEFYEPTGLNHPSYFLSENDFKSFV